MTNKALTGLTLAAAAVLGGLYLFNGPHRRQGARPQGIGVEKSSARGPVLLPTSAQAEGVRPEAPAPQALLASPTDMTGDMATSGTVAAMRARQAEAPLKEMTPSRKALRAEVARDPHGTPESLLRFSLALSSKMNAAQESETKARSFFGELEDCTLGREETGATSVQALCLLNARRLQAQYPSLVGRYRSLEGQADPQSVRLIRDMPL